MNWKLFVPTYKRKEPLILSMLDEDPELEITFCVRSEELDTGFYDELMTKDRVQVIGLGYGLEELGETRERIMSYCRDNNIKYCCMFDDGIINLVDKSTNDSISDVIRKCISQMESDELSDLIIGYAFHKRFGLKTDGSIVEVPEAKVEDYVRYFVAFPTQAVIVNVETANKYNLHYKSLKEVGFEDAAFFADAIKQGLIYSGNKSIVIDGVVPNAHKPGGSHSANDNLEKKYDIQNSRCLDYTGHILGSSLEKRYRSYAGGFLSLIIWNLDYYREVLVDNRQQNLRIIASQFQI